MKDFERKLIWLPPVLRRMVDAVRWSLLRLLKFLLPRLKHGMILAFDDYYCWSSSQTSGERRACAEIFADDKEWSLVPYLQFGWAGMSFVVEGKSLKGVAGATY